MRFINDDVDYPMPDLLLAFKHQPDFIILEAVEENPPRPRMAERGVFDFQYRIQIFLGHPAEG
ncbi:hypothetical protein D9M71_434230 [compost metagenome]